MSTVHFTEFVYWGFLAMITSIGYLAYDTVKSFKSDLSKIAESVFQLNEKVAVILEKNMHLQRQFESHESRIKTLENKDE